MAFADTDQTVFVGRDVDGSIYGVWTERQEENQEELLEDDAEVVAFRAAQAAKVGLHGARADALSVMLEQNLAAAAAAPGAPRALKDYADMKEAARR